MSSRIPSNWGFSTFEERRFDSVHSLLAYPSLTGSKSGGSGRGRGGGRARDLGDVAVLVNHIIHVEEDLSRAVTPLWRRHQQRRPPGVYLQYVRGLIREIAALYKIGVKRGSMQSIQFIGHRVKLVLNPTNENDGEIKLILLQFATKLFGRARQDKELKNFYDLIEESCSATFWVLAFHPFLMTVEERYFFPMNALLDLQTHEGWEKEFLECLLKKFQYGFCSIAAGLYGHAELLKIFKNHRVHFFDSDSLGLLEFVRIVITHGCDTDFDLRLEEVERELSARFPLMLIHLFNFLFYEIQKGECFQFLSQVSPLLSID